MAVEIIAEIAQGYEGDPILARLLSRAAVRAGADSVKFQLVYADELATPDYQHYLFFRQLEMPQAIWRSVAQEVKSSHARFYLDVFGQKSLREAKALGADGVKIHSSDFLNDALVHLAFEQMPRVFISLGGIRVEELEAFIRRHRLKPQMPLCFMYGFQADPTPIEENHLRRLCALQKRFPGYAFGFMDHTEGIHEEAKTVALLSLPFGVSCIEKHLSLDRTLELEDYVSALDPDEFKAFLRHVRSLEAALGNEGLTLTPAELEYRRKAMKSVVAMRALKSGEILTADALCYKRTGQNGGSEDELHRIEEGIGRRLRIEVAPNQPLTLQMLSE